MTTDAGPGVTRRAALFPTCVVDMIAPEVGVACVRLLRRTGHEVSLPDATCCGQPAWNTGEAEAATRVARATLDALAADDADLILIPSGSCATMIKVFWPELFELAGDHDAALRAREVGGRVRELSDYFAGEELRFRQEPPEGTLLHHRSCHMLRELHIDTAPERLLDATGASRVTSSAEGRCCGFGGLFSIKLPETSVAMADEILDAALASGATEVTSCDYSCLMHLEGRAKRRQLPLGFRHIALVLREASE
ncbi:MAG TPA: (Fe-S)-binding protein [Candidatus Dormibacteraeota bacterium]|nr:(Fe-S)-binding protein [Candidatus Dormibacteraeota bacterium]